MGMMEKLVALVIIDELFGIAGRLVCEQLLKNYAGSNVRWAMAGRSRDKLQKTKEALAEVGCKGHESIPFVLADSADRGSLDAMAAQAKVVITTVGCDTADMRRRTYSLDITLLAHMINVINNLT